MAQAHVMSHDGWWTEGNPAPMTLKGIHGTGIAICREVE